MLETIHLQLLLATFAAWSGRQQAKLITYPIEANRILKEQPEEVAPTSPNAADMLGMNNNIKVST